MTFDTAIPESPDATIFLHQLEGLIAELGLGMDAITSNSLPLLKASIARQEALCASLAASTCPQRKFLREMPPTIGSQGDEPMAWMIWKAGEKLQKINRHYSELLKQSCKTLSMLSGLCGINADFHDQLHTSRSKQKTWSCDV